MHAHCQCHLALCFIVNLIQDLMFLVWFAVVLYLKFQLTLHLSVQHCAQLEHHYHFLCRHYLHIGNHHRVDKLIASAPLMSGTDLNKVGIYLDP